MSSSSSSLSSLGGGAAAAAAAGAAAAAAKALGSAKKALRVSASLKVMSVAAAIASRFFMPFTMLWGTEATLGYLMASEMAATFLTPAWNLASRSASVMSRISGSNTLLLSYTLEMTSP